MSLPEEIEARMTSVFYNENDPATATWLANLVEAGRLPSGFVDRRSIADVTAEEVDQHTQAHFFSGIGGWPLALEMAGVDPTLNVWTGSAPCQPFSAAGLQKGEDDDRHLWPIMRGLIEESLPQFFFGEQVASPAGRDWLAVVRADLEALGYEVGAADLCAAGVGSPHIRQRLYFGAVRRLEQPASERRESRIPEKTCGQARNANQHHNASDGICLLEEVRLGDASGQRHELDALLQPGRQDEVGLETSGNAPGVRLEEPYPGVFNIRATGGDVDWLLCRDPSGIPRWRPVRRGFQPMAHGVPNRVVKLRGYGNAIVPQLAAEFISAFMEAVNESE